MLNCFSTLCNFTFRNCKSFSQIHVFFFADLAYEPPWANVPEQSPTINETPSSPTLPEIPAPIPSPRSEITPPKPAPRSLKLPSSGRKFKYEDFQLLKVLGKGSFGKVSALVLLFIILVCVISTYPSKLSMPSSKKNVKIEYGHASCSINRGHPFYVL